VDLDFFLLRFTGLPVQALHGCLVVAVFVPLPGAVPKPLPLVIPPRNGWEILQYLMKQPIYVDKWMGVISGYIAILIMGVSEQDAFLPGIFQGLTPHSQFHVSPLWCSLILVVLVADGCAR